MSGSVTPTCSPTSGSKFGFGTTRVNCSATDGHGNTATRAFNVTVKPFNFLGFFPPVDSQPTINTVKDGSSVPVKWKLQGEGGVEIKDVTAVRAIAATPINCADVASAVQAPIEVTNTGGTSLRYDLTALQFVFNWQTPKTAGTCLRLDVQFTDEVTRSAYFKLK